MGESCLMFMTCFFYISCNILSQGISLKVHIWKLLILICDNQGLGISRGMTLLCLVLFLAATTELKLSSQLQFLVYFVNLFLLPQHIFLLCTFCISEYYYFYCVLRYESQSEYNPLCSFTVNQYSIFCGNIRRCRDRNSHL